MANYNVLLCCGAGMSSGFLAQSAAKAAKRKAPGMSVVAKSQSLVQDVIEEYDILLLGPHYESHLEEFKEIAEPYNIPVAVIPQAIYGTLDGDKLVDFALELLNK